MLEEIGKREVWVGVLVERERTEERERGAGNKEIEDKGVSIKEREKMR